MRTVYSILFPLLLVLSACQPIIVPENGAPAAAESDAAMSTPVAVNFYTSQAGHERFGMIDLATGAGTDIGKYTNDEIEILRTGWLSGGGALYEDAFYTILNKRLPADATPDDAEARLARVDMATGELELLGNIIPVNMIAMEINGCGEVFSAGFTLSNQIGELFGDTNLYRVDRTSGAITLIGDTGLERIMDMSFSPDGTLWATVGNVLYTLDQETGAPTEVAQITGVEEENEIMGIGFTSEGELYATTPFSDGFYRIDTASGAVTEIGRHGFTVPHGGDIPMEIQGAQCETAAERAAEASSATSQRSCTEISSQTIGMDNVKIGRAEVIVNDPNYPTYCLVQGKVNERIGIDGKPYAIGFELRLPTAWNGRFLYQGNGGVSGTVVPAAGISITPYAIGGTGALRRGFAVLSTDDGHNANDPINQEAGLVRNVLFGLDPQARIDYGHAAVGTMTPIAKEIIAQFYGADPDYSYIYGCSNGGRNGMVAATRYADYFDGVLAGSPAHNWVEAALQHAWDMQSFQTVDLDIRKTFSREDMNLVTQGVLAACDALDGAEDGLVNDLWGCQDIFNLADLQCDGTKDATCLSEVQITALERSMAGPTNAAGEALYTDWLYDSGMNAANWRMWKFESAVPAWEFYPLSLILSTAALSYVISTPPTETEGVPEALIDYLVDFDFETDALKIFATDATFTESGMSLMAPLDIANPELAEFKAAGGKMIIYQGGSDGIFPPTDIMQWYETLNANHAGTANDFVRLFVVPAMNHCGRGPATDQFDALTALMNWVEGGQAPDQLLATVNPLNPEVPEEWSKTRTRPICVWPEIAIYQEGDIERAESFTCVMP